MKMKKILSLLPLYFLVVNAQNDTTTPTTLETSGKDKVESANISALYIGDLLRTKPKEVLESSGSVHQPIILNQGYQTPVISAPVAGRSYNYKAHGGHEYVETEYIRPSHLSPEGRRKAPIPDKRVGNTARAIPANVLGHLLTVKPVRVVPISRNSAPPRKPAHYPNDDCSKSGDHSYSSEEKSYVPEQPTYRRAKQIAPGPHIEYRSPQRSYPEDDRSEEYSSQSEPSTGSYSSKTYPSNTDTKSHSSGSYTRSKSTSTSRTVVPTKSKEKVHVIPTRLMNPKDYDNTGPAHGNQDIVVYKVREPRPNEGPSSYTENSEKDYPPSNYESDHKAAPHDSPYSQHPSEVRKPRKPSHRERPYHPDQQSQKDVPQEFGPPLEEQDRGHYGQSPYTSTDEHRYRDQNQPSNSYPPPEHEYNSRPATREPESPKPHYQSYQSPESAHRYEAEQPNDFQSRKRPGNNHYERPSNNVREESGYRSREPQTQGYSYPHEQQLQSSRSRKERPQSSYENYPPQEPHIESVPQTPNYERNHPGLRPSEEKQMQQYAYEATPHQEAPKSSRGTRKRQYKEPSRSVRSPERHRKSAIVEGRSHLPRTENEPVMMVSRESKPYLSRSNSKSNYNIDEQVRPETKANYNDKPQLEDNPTAEGRQNIDSFDANFPTVYKPFNSEYPASYANDPHHTAGRQHQPQNFDHSRSVEQPTSYQGTPRQQSFEHSAENDDSYEEGAGPAKKNKNHHYISKISGFKEEYSPSEPLNIDDAFFEKYGISKKAKVIVATSMNPNLFVADGTNQPEGGYTQTGPILENSGPVHENHGPIHGNSGPSQEYSGPSQEYSGPSQEYSGPSHQYSGPSQGNSGPSHQYSGPSQGNSGPIQEPPYQQNFNDESYNESPEEFSAPRQIPGSFDELVKTNPTFLRKLPQIIDPADAIFNMDASFDDAEFRNVEQKGFVVAQGPREIIQQHGDGVSRIVFNRPNDENKAEASKVREFREEKRRQGEKISSAASNVQEKAVKKSV